MAYNADGQIDDTAPVGTVYEGQLGNRMFDVGVHVLAVRVAYRYDEAEQRQVAAPGWHTMWLSDGSGRYHPSGEALREAHPHQTWTQIYRPSKGKKSVLGRLLGVGAG